MRQVLTGDSSRRRGPDEGGIDNVGGTASGGDGGRPSAAIRGNLEDRDPAMTDRRPASVGVGAWPPAIRSRKGEQFVYRETAAARPSSDATSRPWAGNGATHGPKEVLAVLLLRAIDTFDRGEW